MKREDIINLDGKTLYCLDQRKLPNEKNYYPCHTIEDVFNSINLMVVRGAPLIGFTGIYGLVIWAFTNKFDQDAFIKAANYLKSARPTAVNLAFEIDECVQKVLNKKLNDSAKIASFLIEEVLSKISQLDQDNLSMAKSVESDLLKVLPNKKQYNILTHCNTGRLACGPLGTALGVIEHLNNMGKISKVYADETRPYLQGSRLTSFELTELGINHNIVVEGAASYLMKNKMIDAIFVGADRIALNGDTANKIGTSNLGIIGSYYNIPLYVVAPTSSFDFEIESGDQIEIELRESREITHYKQLQIAPAGASGFNPSFDITDQKHIHGIACEKGLILKPFYPQIKAFR